MKEIHVNAYTKSDGTHVKEHYRTIETNGNTTTPQKQSQNFNSNPVLIGGISMDVDTQDILQGGVSAGGIDWDNIGSAIGQIAIVAANVAIKAAPIALQMYQAMQSQNTSLAENLKPQFDNSIRGLEETQKVMKQNLDNNLNKLTSAKNQEGYANLYKSFMKENETYKRTTASITRIKYAAENQDYETVVNELDNYKNLQKNIISDSFMNSQVDLNIMQAEKNTQKHKPELTGMNYAPMPSPYQNANTQPDWWNNQFNSKSATPWEQIQGMVYQNGNIIGLPTGATYLSNAMQNFKFATNDTCAIVLDSLKDIKNTKLKDTMRKLNIPENSKGILYSYDSEPSVKIAESNTLKQFILENYDKLKTNKIKTAKIEFEAIKDPDLFVALQHVTLLNPQIDEYGNFTTFIIDYYDFEPRTYTSGNIAAYINNWGYSMQEKGLLEKYFILLYINLWVGANE